MFVGFDFVLIAVCSLLVAIGANADEDVPDACKDQTYCSIKPSDYPQDIIDSVSKGAKPIPAMVAASESRLDPDYKNDCSSEVTFQPLYKVRSQGNWHTVVQSPKENYVQMVRLEKCTHNDKPCFSRFSIPTDLETSCQQTLSTWELVVLNADKTSTQKVQVELPLCCSCYYKVKDL